MKRRADPFEGADENGRHLKRRRFSNSIEEELDHIKLEIGDIREGTRDLKVTMREIADQLRIEMDCKLEEVINIVKELRVYLSEP